MGSTQILEAIFFKTVAVQTLTSHLTKHIRQDRHARHCWKSKDKLISDIFLWTPTHGHTSVDQTVKSYIYLLCTNMGCCLEDLWSVMADSDRWQEKSQSMPWWCYWSASKEHAQCVLSLIKDHSIGWGCGMHQFHLCWEIKKSCSGYNTKLYLMVRLLSWSFD